MIETHDPVAALPDGAIPAQRSAPPVRVIAERPARVRRWPSVLGGLAAGLAVGTAGAAGAVVLMTPAAVTAPSPAPRLVADVRGGSADVSVPGRVLTTFGDGTWQVGVDVAPGTYATADAAACRHTGGTDRTVVLPDDGSWFATTGCATWRRVG